MDVTASNGNGDLERYLLGTLPEDARERIDERLLVDTELFDALCVVENELAYDYALGLLTADERRAFEERFLDRPAMQARVQTAAALIDGIRAADPARPRQQWWLYVAAAASIVLIAWLARDNARLRQAAAPQSQVASTQVTPSAPTATPQSPSNPAPSNPPQAAEPAASIVAIVLQPGVVRSGAPPSRIRLRQGDILRLDLTLPASAPQVPSYRASIRNPDDVQVWAGTGAAAKTGKVVTVTVPSALLPPNDYEVTLSVVWPAGAEEIASYALSTTRQ